MIICFENFIFTEILKNYTRQIAGKISGESQLIFSNLMGVFNVGM